MVLTNDPIMTDRQVAQAAQVRIRQLEKQCAVLAAEVDRQRAVVEAARQVIPALGVKKRLDYNGLSGDEERLMIVVAAYEASRAGDANESQHVADTQGPPTPMGRVGGIPIMKINDGKRR